MKRRPLRGTGKKVQSMSAHYSAHKERLSFGIKLKLIKACKLAAPKLTVTFSLVRLPGISPGEMSQPMSRF